MYIEEKKAQTNESVSQRTFPINCIHSLIESYNTPSYEDFQRKIPSDIKIQFLKQLGYIGQNIIKSLIKIYVHTTDRLQSIRNKHFLQLLVDNFYVNCVQSTTVTGTGYKLRAYMDTL
jgi:hypothetical protein